MGGLSMGEGFYCYGLDMSTRRGAQMRLANETHALLMFWVGTLVPQQKRTQIFSLAYPHLKDTEQ